MDHSIGKRIWIMWVILTTVSIINKAKRGVEEIVLIDHIAHMGY
jgi:hypothetical protein